MTDRDLIARLGNPSPELLAAYWRALPKPYFAEAEDPEAARRHLEAIAEQLTKEASHA